MTDLQTVLGQISDATRRSEVGVVLATAARAEGFDNLVLARCIDGEIVDLPWCWFPAGFVETYAENNWMYSDPVLYEAFRSTSPIVWKDLAGRRRFTHSERSVMEIAATLGVRDGLTIPLHGPGASCDLVSLSQRDGRGSTDPARRGIIAMIALNAAIRFQELAATEEDAKRSDLRDLLRYRRRDRAPVLDDFLKRGLNSPFVLSGPHLRALVLVELADRRWHMGLTQLATLVYR
ncbi:MAG: autoinducer binding domain-containing protein, partial [Hyphomicrobium sp.]